MLIVLIVFIGVMRTAPPTPWGMMLAAVALIATPFIPTFFGFGSTIAASIVAVNVALGSYCWKVYGARTEE